MTYKPTEALLLHGEIDALIPPNIVPSFRAKDPRIRRVFKDPRNSKRILSQDVFFVVISGGNIDVNLVSRVIQRGLVKSGRLCRLFITARDVTGTLHGITGAVASARANIVSIEHD